MAASVSEETLSVDTEKMSPTSNSETSSLVEQHASNPAQNDLEKADTTATHLSTTSQPPVRRVTTAQDWTGPDDPDNPLNWSFGWKAYTVAMVGLQAFTSTFGSSVITPSTRQIAEHFQVSITAAILPLTLYVLGLGFGPMLSAPISEDFGRRAVYLLLFPPSLLFTLGAGFAKNFGTLLVCRLLAGTLCSGCLAVGAGTNSDIWSHKHRAAASAVFLLAPFLGPSLGPIVGGFAAQEKGWRWSQWCILFIGAFTYVFSLFQKETYKKIILKRRAKKLDLPPPPDPVPRGLARAKFILTVTVLRPIRMLLTEPIVAFLSIYTAFNFSVLFAFFAAFPVVFESPYPEIQVYHFTTGEEGLTFISIGIGCVCATLAFIIIDRLTYQKTLAKRIAGGNTTNLPPEERLHAAKIGSLLLPVGLFWFGWTAKPHIHWIVPLLALIPFATGNLLVFCATMLYLIDTYGPLGGASAAAANGLLRYVAGAVFPLFTIQMYRAMGVGWTTSLLGFVTVALLPIPWVLGRWGERIRGRSGYT